MSKWQKFPPASNLKTPISHSLLDFRHTLPTYCSKDLSFTWDLPRGGGDGHVQYCAGNLFFLSLFFLFFGDIFWYIARIAMILLSTYSPSYGPPSKYLFHGVLTHRKFFRAIWNSVLTSKNALFGRFQTPKNVIQMGMKTKKSLCTCLCDDKIILKHRMDLPFALGDRYGPKACHKHLQYVV